MQDDVGEFQATQSPALLSKEEALHACLHEMFLQSLCITQHLLAKTAHILRYWLPTQPVSADMPAALQPAWR